MKKLLGENRFGTSTFNCTMMNKAREGMCTSRLFYKTRHKLCLEMYDRGDYTCHAGTVGTQSDSDTLLKVIH